MKISIEVATRFLPEHSDLARDRYAFAYTVTIRNDAEVPARLVARHWIIADAAGQTEEVRGAGVVGETPRLKPGESFTYTSGAVLSAPLGSMHGSYQMQTDSGLKFDAPIPRFELAMPRTLH
jgi:ApaG protein